MSQVSQPTRNNEPTSLDTVDAVARAAHLWVRALCNADFPHPDERRAVAGGLVAGLCEHLELDPRVHDLVAYVYTLLDGETDATLSVSRLMLDRPSASGFRKAYRKGRMEAAAIVEMLAYHAHD